VTENRGDIDVVISDDFFKNKLILPKGKYAMKKVSYQVELNDKNKNLENVIQEDFSIPYRLVYYTENTDDSKKDFFAIEQVAIYRDGQFTFKD